MSGKIWLKLCECYLIKGDANACGDVDMIKLFFRPQINNRERGLVFVVLC